MGKSPLWVNRLLIWLLRSPFHRLASGKVMLVTVTGRRSGHSYTTPVNYVQSGKTVFVLSRQGRTWWKNVDNGANVKLWLRGKERTGCARLVTEPGKVAATLRMFYPKMKPEKIAERVQTRVAIWVEDIHTS